MLTNKTKPKPSASARLLGLVSRHSIAFSVLTLALFGSSGLQAQKVDSVRVFVDSALNLMQQRSLYAGALKWSAVRDSARQLAAGATTYEEAAPALQFAFNLLGDKHGWLQLGGKTHINPFLHHDNSRISDATLSAIRKPAAIRSEVIARHYAYLSIPFFMGQTGAKMNAFAQAIQDSLCKVVTPATKGLIIDLRLNGGGNMFPMIIGVSNAIHNGLLTETVNSLGEKDGELQMKDHSFTLLDTIVVKLSRQCGDLTDLPLVVLTGPATGSSGEQVAIVLSLREKAVLLGEPTAGYVTGNNGFRLPGEGNGIVLGESYTRDRNGKVYLKDVVPAITVTGGDNFTHLGEDKKVQAAIEWLEQQR